ncbi:PqqD family protein [Candidatus Poribacteria bacterium]|nr:PqqD family protein [Candidatus Poribacteria bacterium]
MDKQEELIKKPKKIPRRTFLKATISIVAGTGLGGAIYTILSHKTKLSKTTLSNLPIRNPAFGWHSLDNGCIRCYTTLLDKGTMVYQLNQIGGVIWQACDGRHRVEDMAAEVAEKFSLDFQACLEDTQEFISLLEEQNFIITSRTYKTVQSVWENKTVIDG